jgi:hypothetical protein
LTSGEDDRHCAAHRLSAAGQSGGEGARPSGAWLSDPEVSSQKLPPIRNCQLLIPPQVARERRGQATPRDAGQLGNLAFWGFEVRGIGYPLGEVRPDCPAEGGVARLPDCQFNVMAVQFFFRIRVSTVLGPADTVLYSPGQDR